MIEGKNVLPSPLKEQLSQGCEVPEVKGVSGYPKYQK